ncbi:uncharacterized protein TRAVEDRAFT_48249 [Trametes versicolor FP-101664 SS1]|uniref:uncharacterized protein n=1 Tax=Trametes versicolor (strain FP-101664) TaxID=717944 RepID=UPI0004624381|nr:uncharacterized protein TRAVEDRAFT_48249 [Trametes versicolor FP-101664 SS1]EIW57201.1 hypothetical protein TRAVEDRAFT_48249 [Trametes versicolor FP-101664 SS1]
MSSRNPRSQPLFDSDPSHLAVDIRYQVILTSMACILYYDYFLTLKNEIALVWHSPRSLSKIFFLVIRYGFLLDTTLVLFYTLRITSDSGPTLTASSCKALYDAATIIQVSSFVAVSGKYLRVLTGLGIFSVVAASIPESILPVDIGVIFARAFVPVLTTRFIVNLYQTGRHSSRVDTGTLSLWSFHVAQENGVVSSLAFSRP